MRVSANTKLIKRRSRLGMYASFAGLGVLVAGMVASFRPQYMWLSLVAIILGFILAQYGNYNLRRWGRHPRPDQMIETSLKGFDNRYHLYSWTLPAPYVLLSPQGVYCFSTRDQTGKITVDGSRWHSKFNLGRALLLFAQEGMGNPTSEALAYAENMDTWIKSELPDATVRTQPVIVFIDQRVQLQINEPTVPVLDVKSLKKWLRGAGKGKTLDKAEYKALEELFDAKSGVR